MPSPLSAVAGAVGAVSEVLLERELRLERAVRARRRTELSVGNITLIESARVEAGDADPENAEDTFRKSLDDRKAELNEIDDEQLRDQAALDLLESTERGAIAVRRAAEVKQKDLQQAAMLDFGAQLNEAVRREELDPTSAIEEFESRLFQNSDAYSAVGLEKASQLFRAQIRDTSGDAIRARLAAFSVDLLDKFEDASSDDERANIIADFGEAIAASVDAGAIARDTGVDIDQEFQRQAEVRIKKKISSIARRATSRLNAGDISAIEGLVEEAKGLPDSQEKTDLLNELDSKLTRLNQSKGTGQQILGILFGDRTGSLPQDPLGLNSAYRSVLAANGDVAEFARLLAERRSVFPSDLLKDIQESFDEETLALGHGLNVLRAIEGEDAPLARRLAEASKNSALATTALTMTRGLDVESLEYDRIVSVLSDPAAEAAMVEAGKRLDGSSSENIEPFDVGRALDKYADFEDPIISVDVVNEFEAQFRFAFVDRQVTRRETDGQKITEAAGKIAAENVGAKFVGLEVPGQGTFLAPALLGITPSGRMRDQLQDAIFDFAGQFKTSLFRSASADVRPDLLFVRDGRFYIPALADNETKAFLEYQPHREARRIIDRTTHPKLFQALNDGFMRRSDPQQLIRNAALRFHPGYGVSSIQDFDLKFFPENPGSGLRERILRLVEQEWIERTGDVPDLKDAEQLEQFRRLADLKRQELDWPRWDSTNEAPDQ